MLTSRDRALVTTYAACALAALVGTQFALVRHFTDGGTIGSAFTDPVANPAATFVTIDLMVVAVAALVFLVVEARRIGLRLWWVYVALTFTVAISVALPAFLAHRQILLARQR